MSDRNRVDARFPGNRLGSGEYAPLDTEDKDMRTSLNGNYTGKTADPAPLRVDIPVADSEVPRAFVEMPYFQGSVVLVILANVVEVVFTMRDPSLRHTCYIMDLVLLCFYVLELAFRARVLGRRLVCGNPATAFWGILDIVVVTSRVLDLVVLRFVPGAFGLPIIFQRALPLVPLLWVIKVFRIALGRNLGFSEQPAFQSFIGFVITFNAILMGLETDVDWGGWAIVEQCLLCIYIFELSTRLVVHGCDFFNPSHDEIGWNLLDFVIVCSSAADTWVFPLSELVAITLSGEDPSIRSSPNSFGKMMMLMRMLRLMRILRLAKLIKSFRPLYILVNGVLAAMQGVVWVLLLTITVLYAMGITATRLIAHGIVFPIGSVPPKILLPFGTVPDSMFTLFRVMSGSSSDVEQEGIDELLGLAPAAKFVFAFFMITSSWTLLSILTAVVSENMISTTAEEQLEDRIVSDEEERIKHMQQLRDMFTQIDSGGDGTVGKEELDDFLSDPENSESTARKCKVPVRDIKDVLRVLHLNIDDVTMEDFVDHLADISNPATEKSMLKIEAHLRTMQRDSDKYLAMLDGKIMDQQTRTATSLFELDEKLLQGQQIQKSLLESVLLKLDTLEGNQHLEREVSSSVRERLAGICDLTAAVENLAAAPRIVSAFERRHVAAAEGITADLASLPALDQRVGDAIAGLREMLRASGEAIDGLSASVQALHDPFGLRRSHGLSRARAQTAPPEVQRLHTSSLAALRAKLEATSRGASNAQGESPLVPRCLPEDLHDPDLETLAARGALGTCSHVRVVAGAAQFKLEESPELLQFQTETQAAAVMHMKPKCEGLLGAEWGSSPARTADDSTHPPASSRSI